MAEIPKTIEYDENMYNLALYVEKLKHALRLIKIGAENQGAFTGMGWNEVRKICADALKEESK